MTGKEACIKELKALQLIDVSVSTREAANGFILSVSGRSKAKAEMPTDRSSSIGYAKPYYPYESREFIATSKDEASEIIKSALGLSLESMGEESAKEDDDEDESSSGLTA